MSSDILLNQSFNAHAQSPSLVLWFHLGLMLTQANSIDSCKTVEQRDSRRDTSHGRIECIQSKAETLPMTW